MRAAEPPARRVRVRRVRRQYGREYYGGGDSNKASLFPL